MSTTTRAKKYDSDDILSPAEVLELMPPTIKIGWLYSNWSELGGVTIGNKKLIKYGVLNANLEGERRKVVCEMERTHQGQQKISQTVRCWDGANELQYEKGSSSCGTETETLGSGEVCSGLEEEDKWDLASAL